MVAAHLPDPCKCFKYVFQIMVNSYIFANWQLNCPPLSALTRFPKFQWILHYDKVYSERSIWKAQIGDQYHVLYPRGKCVDPGLAWWYHQPAFFGQDWGSLRHFFMCHSLRRINLIQPEMCTAQQSTSEMDVWMPFIIEEEKHTPNLHFNFQH